MIATLVTTESLEEKNWNLWEGRSDYFSGLANIVRRYFFSIGMVDRMTGY